MEQEHNRVPVEEKTGYQGHTCDLCGAERVDSMFLHRHVCPDDPEHRENYDMEYLERHLLGDPI